jgi:hypothetical protein
MPFMQMCCDESGKWHNSQWIVLGGLIGPPKNWDAFNRDWRLLLKKHGLAYLHMVEAVHCKGEFKHFRNRETERNAILQDFAELIPNGITPIVSTVHLPTKKSAIQARQFDAFEAAMNLAFSQLLEGESLSLICDQEEEMAIPMYKLWRSFRMRHPPERRKAGMIGFADDEAYTPLQAADMWASTCFQLKLENVGFEDLFKKLYEAITIHRIRQDTWIDLG